MCVRGPITQKKPPWWFLEERNYAREALEAPQLAISAAQASVANTVIGFPESALLRFFVVFGFLCALVKPFRACDCPLPGFSNSVARVLTLPQKMRHSMLHGSDEFVEAWASS